MIKVAFSMIGGRRWTGGYNYLVNLLRVLGERAADRVTPVLFIGTDLTPDLLAPLAALPHVEVVRHADFNETSKMRRLGRAIVTGRDRVALGHFAEHGIQVVFESAQFHGWRFDLPAIAWTPDFQHRYLKHLFGAAAYWKRELGIQAQILSKRQIMLSSADAKRDCERFYPASRGLTHVVRFAVMPRPIDTHTARAIADSYGLPDQFFFLPNQFWQHKNHDCVIRALRILRQRGEPVVIAVTGKQEDNKNLDYFPQLMSRVESWQLQEQFRLLGLIPFAHVAALMQCARAVINPSLFEGWSTTVEEAKSIGVPMLLSSIAVHKEQADGRAIFFDPHRPEDLAEAISTFVALPEHERKGAYEAAAIDAERRINRYADEFCAVVESAARGAPIFRNWNADSRNEGASRL